MEFGEAYRTEPAPGICRLLPRIRPDDPDVFPAQGRDMRQVGVRDGCPAFGEYFGIHSVIAANQVQGHGVDVLFQPGTVANRFFSIKTDRSFERASALTKT